MYDLTSDGGYRCLFELDVGHLLQKYWNHKETSKAMSDDEPSFISSQPSWHKQIVPDDEKESTLEPGTTVLGVCFIRNQQQPCAEENSVALHKVLFGSQSGSTIKWVAAGILQGLSYFLWMHSEMRVLLVILDYIKTSVWRACQGCVMFMGKTLPQCLSPCWLIDQVSGQCGWIFTKFYFFLHVFELRCSQDP